MKTYGLIGKNIHYSFSANYFAEKFIRENIKDATYQNFDLENLNNVQHLFDNNHSGYNVTIPYKEAIFPFLDDISPEAKAIGAVNTIKVIDNKKIGHNTDCHGFEKSLIPLLKPHHKKALILGYGGAAKAIEFVLKKIGIPHLIAVRNPKIATQITFDAIDKKIIENHQIIINCTPLGTFPNIDNFPPIPYEYLNDSHLLYDLIYNPEETTFLKKGKEKQATIKNGYEMLVLQAEKAWEIWNL